MVGVVGARNASGAGRMMAAKLARELGRTGLIIASGLARGIDAAAHEAGLDTGTLAALAGGHDRPYPPENLPLLEQILERGVVITEMPLGWVPRARDFPRRNRLVSGVSLGVLVVEAAERSGSLITARLAGEQGRDVFAVPGSPLDPRAAGTNQLIKQGAGLVTSAADILDALGPFDRAPARGLQGTACPVRCRRSDREHVRGRILALLGPTPLARRRPRRTGAGVRVRCADRAAGTRHCRPAGAPSRRPRFRYSDPAFRGVFDTFRWWGSNVTPFA